MLLPKPWLLPAVLPFPPCRELDLEGALWKTGACCGLPCDDAVDVACTTASHESADCVI